MRKRFTRVTFLMALGFGAVAAAQQNRALSPLPPDGFLIKGDWKCEGSFRNGTVHKARFTGATILGDKWLELTEQDVQPATGYLAKYLIGYDSDEGRLIEFDANNFGAAVYTSEQGWQAQVLTMSSPTSLDAKAPYAANRFRYSVVAKDEFNVDWEISKSADLHWMPADHLSCKRVTKI